MAHQQITVDEQAITRAVAALRDGQLVAFPTETVYGLGADAGNADAVRRVFAAKGRPADHPVIVHLPDAALLDHWAAQVPDAARRLAQQFWPGPLTLILPRAAHVLDVVTGGQDSVGLRVPDHPVALALLRAFAHDTRGGLVAPSANRFGRISPTRAEHVRAELGDAVAMILDGGPSRVGVESTIIDLSGAQPMLLRPGQLSVAAIEATLGQPLALPTPSASPATRAPGTLASHYAPTTPLLLIAPEQLLAELTRRQAAGERIAVLARRPAPAELAELPWLVAPMDADGYARMLYAALRELDALGATRIVVEAAPDDPAWLAVRDRLRRAAHAYAEQEPAARDG
jgi:L-threonylcarbamoyladenylate synthase